MVMEFEVVVGCWSMIGALGPVHKDSIWVIVLLQQIKNQLINC